MNHWVAQALSLLMALCLFLLCFAAAEEAAQTTVTIDFEDGNAAAFSQSGSCTVGVTESQAHSGKQIDLTAATTCNSCHHAGVFECGTCH